MKKTMLSLAAAIIFFSINSCEKEAEATDCEGVSATYTTNVKSIIDSNCATSGCHDAVSAINGLNLTTYNSVKAAAQNSNFLCSIKWENSCTRMPFGGAQLSSSAIQTITCWVESGTPE